MAYSAILTYHSLDGSGSAISVRPETFAAQMETLAASGRKVVPLADLARHPSAIAITFDDGFANFASDAAPVLARLSLPATVFVVGAYAGKRNNWPTQPPGFPELPLMSWSALRDLPPVVSLGAHTMTHPDLRALSDREMAVEIRDSRVEVEQRTGRPVSAFAYPYGALDGRAAALVRQEFAVGCGTRLAFVRGNCDPAELPRLDAYYLQSEAWMARLFGYPARMYIGARRSLRAVRAAAYRASSATTTATRPSQ